VIAHLYVHIPFCAKICPYCSFYVHRGGAEFQRRFVAALTAEIRAARATYDLELATIYFGGGTPSMLSAELFSELAAALPPCAGEVTLEANPATVTEAKAAAWRRAGVNRISLGVQSFDADYLALLGRQHSPAEAQETVWQLRRHGFDNLNIDLMFALPQQSEISWRATLNQAIACHPEHISCYALTYEEDTPFFKQLQLGTFHVDEAREIRMFTETIVLLENAGLLSYEISSFSRPGRQAQHNRAYWLGHDYLGVGPSAYSTVGSRRWANVRDTEDYITKIGRGETAFDEIEELTPAIRHRERIMFGLRLSEGVESSWLMPWSAELPSLLAEHLLEARAGRFRLTSRGRLVADSVAAIFA
jgi:oxygen-independent coproporphyrinogen III oxidase